MKTIVHGIAALALVTATLAVSTDANATMSNGKFSAQKFFADLEKVVR